MYLASAARLARQRAPALRRCIATTIASHPPPSASSSAAPIPLSNVEASWTKLSPEEKANVHQQLEEVQKKDWKELSTDQKKAAYYVAFGPHGPRTPSSAPGDTFKILLYTTALVGVAGTLFLTLRAYATPPPRTMSKEWEEATNERALEMKLNPISGISSEGYAGKGFVQTK
ncbi:cytochrome c oxidase subunit IV [Macrolepiota fuliginosa MF-IS2]|uniref:Cytochrome c oxidase subunit IV n=1 Tax=Macrolepiota fuliginosa MF-IS2 TaxID=1400762 RepID=A0A9P5XG02_9AGAR|nr:cytochrome c oxidase subunit IV [Macrolepiota fuliginosa MF-IS2]